MLDAIIQYESRACRIDSVGDLTSLTDSFIRSIGYGWFTFIRPSVPGAANSSVLMTSYPKAWVDQILEERRHVDDPVHAAVSRSIDGVEWRRIAEVVALTDRQNETMRIARERGLRNGTTVPFRLPGTPCAMFSVAVSSEDQLASGHLLAAKLVGAVLFARLEKILDDRHDRLRMVNLSPRQIDCVRLIAKGLTDRAIGQTLGLSSDTVKEYVEGAKRRYHVNRRSELVVAAIRDAHVTIDDTADWLIQRTYRA